MSDTLHEANAEVERRIAADAKLPAARTSDAKDGEYISRSRTRMANGLMMAAVIAAALGCAPPINPVRYETVPVLVTRPCYAGIAPPAEAVEIGEESCTGKYAECVRDRKADIQELRREARQYRQLFKECSK